MSVLAFVVAAGSASLIGSPVAHAYRDLCGSVPSACAYTGPDAPVLAAAVCWERSTAAVTLMSADPCPNGSWPYFVEHGLVDPLTLKVAAFQPLDDACSRPGLCVPANFTPNNTSSGPICCFGNTCYPDDGECYGGEILYCLNGVSNEDGTVTCFESF